MKIFNKTLLLSLIILLAACGGKGNKETTSNDDGLNDRNEIRLKQYQVKGAQLYATYCVNCHQQNGEGLANLFPPLAGSDYLLEDLPRAACVIKNGATDPIVVNGREYTQIMPANDLTPLEIAEILTFITNAWDNGKGLSGVKDVEKWLTECSN
ncbi:cytochrome c [Marinoscillum sp. MHG1-6]|uniref:c-type cytochrome n=1 Tax=Marinoscillum sp. MHG1-6 TaxID=2959627 RepID=UPI0021581F5C|nr:cytochrome c [Marinoscillum sp. MHG1-6]